MKTIKNQTTTIEKGEGAFLTYADFIKVVTNNIPQGGMNIEEIAKRQRILDATSAAKEEIKLEDADAEKLKELVKNMAWTLVHKDIIVFGDEIKSL